MPSDHIRPCPARPRPAGARPSAAVPFEVEAVFPEPAATAREVTLLYPRAGQPFSVCRTCPDVLHTHRYDC